MKTGLSLLSCIVLLSCHACGTSEKARRSPGAGQDCSLEAGLKELTDQIISSLSQKGKSKIAIVEFVELEGKTTRLGKFLAEEMITRLYSTGEFDVVERQLLNKVIVEQKLGESGFIDEESAVSLGRILGVEAIATGSITDLGPDIKVNARLIATETGSVFSAASARICKDVSLLNLMESVDENPGASGRNEGDAAGKSTGSVEPKALRDQAFTKESHGFVFKLEGCQRSAGTKVKCCFAITSTGKDRELQLALHVWAKDETSTRSFDNLGNEHTADQINLGSKRARLGAGGYTIKGLLISGVPVKAKIWFEKVPADAIRFARLDLGLIILDEHTKIEFRNVPILE